MSSTIAVFSATSQALTELSAFDAALHDVGLGDVNIVTLSSVIPPNTSVIPDAALPDLGIGDLAFCVMAEHRATAGTAAAGLAWAIDSEGRGGVFLEAHGDRADRIDDELRTGIEEMIARRPYLDLGAPSFQTTQVTSEGPCAALVIAFYEARPFNVGQRVVPMS